MKLLKVHKNIIKIEIEHLDDLWYLSNIIEENDEIEGKTFRKIKIGDENDRQQKIVRKPVFLKINVEKLEFHKYSDNLRVSGKVSEGKEDIAKGSYHTFNLEPGVRITIIKKELLKYHKQRLQEACSEKPPEIIICIMDREEAYISLLKASGYELLTRLKGNVTKKADVTQPTGNFYSDVLNNLEEYSLRYKTKSIIIASPAFWKDEIMKCVKNDELKKKIVLATCSSCDTSAINEVMKRPEIQNVLKQDRVSKEIQLVEKLLTEVSNNGACAYGTTETKNAANLGAIEKLLITDGFIQKRRINETFKEIEEIMKTADKNQAEIRIINSDHDGGKKLDGLGGIAALLRYKMNY